MNTPGDDAVHYMSSRMGEDCSTTMLRQTRSFERLGYQYMGSLICIFTGGEGSMDREGLFYLHAHWSVMDWDI